MELPNQVKVISLLPNSLEIILSLIAWQYKHTLRIDIGSW
jgi:hypothetical protein